MNTIIFDMDGVLIDSEYTYFESKTNILNDAGYDVGVSYQYQFMGTTYNYMLQTMKDELKLPLEVEDYIKEMNQRRKDIVEKDGVKPIKNIQKLIKRLYKSEFRMAVASSSPKIDIEFAIKSLDLNQYFEFLVSGEEVENSKPEPDIFLYAASLLEVCPNECIVFEDTKNGSKAVKAANMYTIGFANPDYPKQDLSIADEIITDFSEVNIQELKNK
ncbi:haloacid dehalogenase [Marinilactibacillus sp. 15R]|uniref:HAD family hydrolase n=1 Tax=Marinilactibacillus sp. 15R TaxID=1911586 RepID=UPI00090A39FC|nr:HAD-IA family hydrolase [Marinilactibacillus sp. 15R]API90068.1 haloacid dehalogenase [Marinilactibacillus sp. 15R]